jgi:TonB-linked SusC/RagA family outer membrane protein
MQTREVPINGRSTIDVEMQPEVEEMEEVVVTALGISREKKSLGYSVQDVGGENIAKSKQSNPIDALSGKIAGVNIKQSNTMGGSANMIIRGWTSITGNNQPLFVVDGVPIDNSVINSEDQQTGGGGYDFGNAAMDINPEDIKNISVLKGSAATALYGSRAARGVVLITTKKGQKSEGLGVTVNSSYTVSTVNDKTFPQHQHKYGAGYFGGSFINSDLDGDGEDEKVVKTMDDASWGSEFDPSMEVIHWDALYPEDDNYLNTRPWSAPSNTIEDFFRPATKAENSISFSGGNQEGNFRFSYTNAANKGILPNSNSNKHNFSFNGSYDFTERLTVQANANYVNNRTTGRFGTGYDGRNVMQSFGQWFQTNVDFARLEDYKSSTGRQKTWNIAGPVSGNLRPIYFNNPYWVRNEMWENDGRDRFYGKAEIDYDLTDWLTFVGRFGLDYYHWFRNQRIAEGSLETSEYSKATRTNKETNTDLMLRFDKELGNFSFSGVLGTNFLRRETQSQTSETVGGLIVPNKYFVSNSSSPTDVFDENYIDRGKNSYYGSVSIGYNELLYLELTGRNDISSTLPDENNSYFYPSVSTNLVFSELIESDVLSFGKVRLSYAEVGNDAPAYRTASTYTQYSNWLNLGLFSVDDQAANPDLKPENTVSYEAGLETYFLERRVGFDISLYKNNTFNQIMPVDVTDATGVDQKFVNGGELQNKGIEVTLTGTPIETNNFSWDISVNWAQSENKVVDLAEGIENYLLFSAWGVSVNATEGQPFGAIKGKDFIYEDGKRVVYPDDAGFAAGRFQETEKDQVLGNIQPDWNAGISTTLSYKNLSLDVLFDIQQGGDIYSVNQKYGMATGVYEETVGKNDRGGNIRGDLSNNGGYKFPNTVYPDGSPNETYISNHNFFSAWYYGYIPEAYNVYDASYVKLRDVSLTYSFPDNIVSKTPFTRLQASLIGHNLAILHKNTPHFDPEAILSAGRYQGIEHGAYPTKRMVGFNLTLGL